MKNPYIELSIVVPVYNEEDGIRETYSILTKTFEDAFVAYEIVFVDDGSRDQTYALLQQFKEEKSANIKIVKLARNFGHQLAITAGLKAAVGTAVVVTDGDLQDPPEVILEFLKQWRAGYQVVYGVRTQREGERFFKRATAKIFYKLLRMLTSIDIPENVGDFYLLDRKVVDLLNSMEERHRFLRGLIVWVGFKRKAVEYKRRPRLAGQTKFSLWRMIKFSLDAATSFSFMPLRFILIIGSFICLLSFLGIGIIIYEKLFTDRTVTGWASLMIVILFIGGVQLLAIGLIGEYIARIGDDVKRRPLYTVEEML